MKPLRPFLVSSVLFALSCQAGQDSAAPSHRGVENHLFVGVGGEPLTFNLLLATDVVSKTIGSAIHAALVRVNLETQQVEPALAESWSFSDDGKLLTFRLRRGVRFSDGHPFTAQDVAFTFRALHDPNTGSPLAQTAQVDGKPLRPEVVDDLTVRFRLPRRTAVLERVFDGIYVLPRHRLESSFAARSFASAYGVGATESDIVGLGPFVLERYLPGQRVILHRNPYYWKTGPEGRRLPYLDGIVFEILPDSNARLLRFSAGELDIQGELLPEDFLHLSRRHLPELRLVDLGPGMVSERLWFNLNPRSPALSAEKRSWFGDERFRRAISCAIDRAAIVAGVYHGLASAALGPVSPANWKWRNEAVPPPGLDRGRARRLLEEAGFTWSGEGRLLGPGGEPVRFHLVTNGDNRHRMRMAMLIQEDLQRLGIEMKLVPLDFADLIGRLTRSFDYEACLLGITQSDPDPSAELALWRSGAPLHLWNPLQKEPATTWEARIDDLMELQMAALDPAERKRLYDEVQSILVEKMPLIDLVVPHALLGITGRVQNLKPTPYWSPPLWNCEELSLAGSP